MLRSKHIHIKEKLHSFAVRTKLNKMLQLIGNRRNILASIADSTYPEWSLEWNLLDRIEKQISNPVTLEVFFNGSLRESSPLILLLKTENEQEFNLVLQNYFMKYEKDAKHRLTNHDLSLLFKHHKRIAKYQKDNSPLIGINFSGLMLKGLHFPPDANLRKTDFSQADLRGATVYNIHDANLNDADIFPLHVVYLP